MTTFYATNAFCAMSYAFNGMMQSVESVECVSGIFHYSFVSLIYLFKAMQIVVSQCWQHAHSNSRLSIAVCVSVCTASGIIRLRVAGRLLCSASSQHPKLHLRSSVCRRNREKKLNAVRETLSPSPNRIHSFQIHNSRLLFMSVLFLFSSSTFRVNAHCRWDFYHFFFSFVLYIYLLSLRLFILSSIII